MRRELRSKRYERLRQLLSGARKSRGLTQTALAAKLKRPQSFVSKYESGEQRLDIMEFLDVCSAVGVSAMSVIRQLE